MSGRNLVVKGGLHPLFTLSSRSALPRLATLSQGELPSVALLISIPLAPERGSATPHTAAHAAGSAERITLSGLIKERFYGYITLSSGSSARSRALPPRALHGWTHSASSVTGKPEIVPFCIFANFIYIKYVIFAEGNEQRPSAPKFLSERVGI